MPRTPADVLRDLRGMLHVDVHANNDYGVQLYVRDGETEFPIVCSSEFEAEALLALANELAEADAALSAGVEPVAWMFVDQFGTHFCADEPEAYPDRAPLYLAPPAPAVPKMNVDLYITVEGRSYAEGWNQCRAAMLASAPPAVTANVQLRTDDPSKLDRYRSVWLMIHDHRERDKGICIADVQQAYENPSPPSDDKPATEEAT